MSDTDEPRGLREGFRLVGIMIRMHPAPFSIAIAGAALYAAAGVGATIVLGQITDDIVLPSFDGDDPSTRTLLLAGLTIIAVAFARMVGIVTRRYFAGMFSERVSRTLRHRLRDRYLGLPPATRRNLPVGELIARADNDADVMVMVLHPLPFSLGVVFLAIFSAIALLLIDIPLAFLSFLVFPTMTFLNRLYTKRVEAPAAQVQRSVGVVSSIAHESFDGALVVKTLGRQAQEAARFDLSVDELQGHRQRVGFLRAAFDAGIGALPYLGIVAVIAIGVFRVDAGAVSPGELVQIASLFTVLSVPMRVFGFFLQTLPPSLVAHSRISDALALPVVDEPRDTRPIGDGPLSVTAEAVEFAWPDADAVLTDISLTVESGEIVAVVGSTGSGKSTLCEVLTGLLVPDHGEVRLDGVPLANLSVEDRTSAIALVFQESFLFADSVRANIDLADDATDADFELAIDVAQVSEFIDVLPNGLDTIVGERGVTLSGGQRQRVALARALVRRPQVILLDDATSAIDPQIEQRILDGLRTNLSATTIVVAQRLSTIRLADRVVWIDQGHVAAAGHHDDLLEHPGYRALVTAYEAAR
ncbi:MAG: ABC transporter ATP-binding protein [Actinomycetota bacterium]